MRKVAVPLLVALMAVVAACGPKTIPAPIVTSPKFPDFLAPAVPPGLAGGRAAENQDRGWRFLQTGDFKNAEREFSTALKVSPAFYPAETALGYLDLARKDAKAALPRFDHVIAKVQAEPSALVGRAQALTALGRNDEALVAFEAALAADPSLADVRRRVEVLKFRNVEQGLARAREAQKAGRLDEAIAAYKEAIGRSPDSPFLYRELGAVERQKGDASAALETFRRAVGMDPGDARTFAQIGEILDAENDVEGAAEAYQSSLALEPDDAIEQKLEALRARSERARLPAEYRAIDQASQINRADLAALIGVRLARLLQSSRRRDAVVITDVRNHWAATWIMAVVRAGVMEPFANHAFQPRTTVRRIDLAQAVSRLLGRIAAADPGAGRAWQTARGRFSDLSAGHLAYPAASAAVAAGVMSIGTDNAFQPSKTVSGAEAVETIGRIEALAASLAPRGGIGP